MPIEPKFERYSGGWRPRLPSNWNWSRFRAGFREGLSDSARWIRMIVASPLLFVGAVMIMIGAIALYVAFAFRRWSFAEADAELSDIIR